MSLLLLKLPRYWIFISFIYLLQLCSTLWEVEVEGHRREMTSLNLVCSNFHSWAPTLHETHQASCCSSFIPFSCDLQTHCLFFLFYSWLFLWNNIICSRWECREIYIYIFIPCSLVGSLCVRTPRVSFYACNATHVHSPMGWASGQVNRYRQLHYSLPSTPAGLSRSRPFL